MLCRVLYRQALLPHYHARLPSAPRGGVIVCRSRRPQPAGAPGHGSPPRRPPPAPSPGARPPSQYAQCGAGLWGEPPLLGDGGVGGGGRTDATAAFPYLSGCAAVNGASRLTLDTIHTAVYLLAAAQHPCGCLGGPAS